MSIYYMIINEIRHIIIPCLIAFFIVIFIRIFTVEKQKKVIKGFKINPKREIALVIFWTYIAALLCATLLPEYGANFVLYKGYFHLPDLGDPNTIILRPPTGWIRWMVAIGDYAELFRNIAGNIIIFIPFGALLPYIWKKAGARTILFGFLLSFFIEFFQLFTDRQTDIYDIIMNTAGCVLGYLIYVILRLIKRKCRSHKKKKQEEI